MSKQFTVITKDGSKWLRPVRDCVEAQDYIDEIIDNAFGTTDIPYIGSRPDGTTVDESEVTEIARHKEYIGSDWFNVYDNGNWDYHETRTVYTDAESHERHISDDYWKRRCEAAEKLIGMEPSDPKTYDKFCRLREEWEQIAKQEPNEK